MTSPSTASFYIAARATTLLTLAVLAGLKPLEDVWHDREKIADLVVTAKSDPISIDTLRVLAGIDAAPRDQVVGGMS